MRLKGCLLLLVATACESAPPPTTTEPAGTRGQTTATELPARPLRLGRPPNLSAQEARAEYVPLAEHLGRVIGHPITVVVPESYDKVVELLVAGELDLALLTPWVYVKTKERLPALRLLASIVGEGTTRYRGYIVVSAEGPLRSLGELKGKRFAFVDPASASGYLFPRALLVEAGLVPERDFSSVRFAGDHPAVAHLVLRGEVDAGAVSSTTFVHLRGERLERRLRILAKTEPIPFDAFVAHPSVPDAVVQKLHSELLQLSVRTSEGRAILSNLTTISGFVDTTDEHYEVVRSVAARANR